MANYSSQKIKSVSLNKGVKRYAASDLDTAVVQATSKATRSKPLIHPLSEGGIKQVAEPEIATTKPVAFDWEEMFHRTFFSVYLEKDDNLVGSGKFDYVFNIGSQRLYVLVHQEDLLVSSTDVPIKVINKLKQQAATHITKRFQQIKNKLVLSYEDEQKSLEHVHYIGLTALNLVHNNKDFQVEHEYGSEFFQEDCVLDLDDESKILQLFSLNSFFQVVKVLQTPSDMLSFFDYHLSNLVNYKDFTNELLLAKEFLNSKEFFERAIAVQEKLVDIGLLAKVESRLTNITHSNSENADANVNKSKLINDLQQYSTMFQKLLNGATKRRHKVEDTIPVEQIKILVNESMYTRMSIMEEIVAYEHRSITDCKKGYLCHQHSYNNFGNHYVIVVYGLDENAEYSREVIERNHASMLMDINAQLQDPAMSEYFILGFDMSNHDGNGNVTVQMDIYHQSGSVMSETEKNYYEKSSRVIES